jgi:hypothetical protein
MTATQNAINDTQLDTAINELDRAMNACEPGDEVPEFTDDCMVKMRAILRKLVASGGVVTQ